MGGDYVFPLMDFVASESEARCTDGRSRGRLDRWSWCVPLEASLKFNLEREHLMQ